MQVWTTSRAGVKVDFTLTMPWLDRPSSRASFTSVRVTIVFAEALSRDFLLIYSVVELAHLLLLLQRLKGFHLDHCKRHLQVIDQEFKLDSVSSP